MYLEGKMHLRLSNCRNTFSGNSPKSGFFGRTGFPVSLRLLTAQLYEQRAVGPTALILAQVLVNIKGVEKVPGTLIFHTRGATKLLVTPK